MNAAHYRVCRIGLLQGAPNRVCDHLPSFQGIYSNERDAVLAIGTTGDGTRYNKYGILLTAF